MMKRRSFSFFLTEIGVHSVLAVIARGSLSFQVWGVIQLIRFSDYFTDPLSLMIFGQSLRDVDTVLVWQLIKNPDTCTDNQMICFVSSSRDGENRGESRSRGSRDNKHDGRSSSVTSDPSPRNVEPSPRHTDRHSGRGGETESPRETDRPSSSRPVVVSPKHHGSSSSADYEGSSSRDRGIVALSSLYSWRHAYIGMVLLTFSPAKYTVEIIIRVNKLYIIEKPSHLLHHTNPK